MFGWLKLYLIDIFSLNYFDPLNSKALFIHTLGVLKLGAIVVYTLAISTIYGLNILSGAKMGTEIQISKVCSVSINGGKIWGIEWGVDIFIYLWVNWIFNTLIY